MNKSHFLSFLALLVLFSFQATDALAQSARAVQQQGIALYNQGNYAEALQKFEALLRANPSNPYARAYASKCRLAIKQNLGSKTNTLEAQLAKVILPNVDFQEVPLGDVLTYIRQRTMEISSASGSLVTPNIIFSGSSDQRDAALITMRLNSVPVTTLLKYVGDQARCRVRYDQHAVLVTPLDNIPRTQAASAAGTTTDPNLFKAAPNPFE